MDHPATAHSKIGRVSAERYEQLVSETRELVATVSKAQFAIGDLTDQLKHCV
ncbi:hypothetical protein [Nonomuraea sp. NPDC049784]|uniref:hypothetical protein n=1 Tax=Nonomuraea sp. NPDC049784 TaxID=3154361 RepID=UPI0033F0C84B